METRTLMYAAGAFHVVAVAINFVVPGRLDFDGGLTRTTAIVRQIFRVHHAYIVAVVAFFAALFFAFPAELAGGTDLGRTVTGFIALFWGARLPVQLLYYDPEVRRANRLEDVLFCGLLVLLAGIPAVVLVRGLP